MKITTTPCDPNAPGFIDHWCATDQDGRRFYAPTEAGASAMAQDYNRPLKGESRVARLEQAQVVE